MVSGHARLLDRTRREAPWGARCAGTRLLRLPRSAQVGQPRHALLEGTRKLALKYFHPLACACLLRHITHPWPRGGEAEQQQLVLVMCWCPGLVMW